MKSHIGGDERAEWARAYTRSVVHNNFDIYTLKSGLRTVIKSIKIILAAATATKQQHSRAQYVSKYSIFKCFFFLLRFSLSSIFCFFAFLLFMTNDKLIFLAFHRNQIKSNRRMCPNERERRSKKKKMIRRTSVFFSFHLFNVINKYNGRNFD